jgi:hypothetical protein
MPTMMEPASTQRTWMASDATRYVCSDFRMAKVMAPSTLA